MDPFSLALAKAVNPDLISTLLHKKKDLGYADFITHDMFLQANVIFSARAVRTGAIDRSALDSKAVIVGAGWTRDSSGRGPGTDMHPTPVGEMVGVELQANLAEALLDSRVFEALPKYVTGSSELAFGAIAAMIFALTPRFWGKAVWLLVLMVLMFGLSAWLLRWKGLIF